MIRKPSQQIWAWRELIELRDLLADVWMWVSRSLAGVNQQAWRNGNVRWNVVPDLVPEVLL